MLQDEKKTSEVIHHLSKLPVYFRFPSSLPPPSKSTMKIQGEYKGTKGDVKFSNNGSDSRDRSGSLVQGYIMSHVTASFDWCYDGCYICCVRYALHFYIIDQTRVTQ